MIRSTKKIMVSNENFDFEFSAFLTVDPKKHVYHQSHSLQITPPSGHFSENQGGVSVAKSENFEYNF